MITHLHPTRVWKPSKRRSHTGLEQQSACRHGTMMGSLAHNSSCNTQIHLAWHLGLLQSRHRRV